jgi:ribosome-binding ATPase YchF (GTP1/OBG family)
MNAWKACLESGEPLRSLDLDDADRSELKAAGLLTGKPQLLVANATSSDDEPVEALERAAPDTPLIVLDAELELELQELDPDERGEFMRELEMEATGLDRLTRAAFDLLGLVSFYTVVKNKLQAWEIPRGTPAHTAAGKIHSDMEAGFIRAKVVSADKLVEVGNLTEIRSLGHIRTVGRDHEIEDGDVVEFLFSGS